MRRTLLLVLAALLLAVPAGAQITTAVPGGGDAEAMAFCKTGKGKGIGYNTAESCWLATCGNYNWSAVVGGAPAAGYSTATTAGGNSWTMECTGAAAATGTPAEDNICLAAGESIKMNYMADVMLAHDNTCWGGKVYLPPGLYHDGGCGQSAAAVANSCPWLQRDYTHEQRAVQMYGGIKLVGAGAQWSDAVTNGRDQSKTTIIQDRGNGDGTDTDPGGDAGAFGRWNNYSGMSHIPRQCKTGQDALATLACINNTNVLGRVGFSRYGRYGGLLGAAVINNANGVCVDNTLATTGICESDPRIRCTTAAGDRPVGGDSGDCDVVGGSCLGYADMIAADLTASKDVYVALTFGYCGWGDTGGAECNDSAANAAFGRITAIGAACEAAAGKFAEFEAVINNDNNRLWPFPAGTYDTTDLAGTVTPVDTEEFYNETGGYQDISYMQGEWAGRSPCTDGSQVTCNDLEVLAMGVSYKGGFDRVSVQYSGSGVVNGTYGWSVVDGMAYGAFQTHMRDSQIYHIWGTLTDAAGWIFENNTWIDNNCVDGPCIKTTFSNGFFMRGDRVIRNRTGASVISFNLARGSTFRDLEFISNESLYGLFRNDYSGLVMIDGVRGYGNKGPVMTWSPKDPHTIWSNTIRNVNLTAQDTFPPGGGASANALFSFTDFDGNGLYNAGLLKAITIDNVNVDVAGTANTSLFFFGGGIGDEQAGGQDAAANGSGRVIQYQRDQVSIVNASINHFGSGTPCAFALGNSSATENDCAERIGDIWASKSGMPAWRNVRIDGVPIPDHPIVTTLAANTSDCDDLVKNVSVWIYDDDTAVGTCTDVNGQLSGGAAAGSRFTSCCTCNGIGDWGECAF